MLWISTMFLLCLLLNFQCLQMVQRECSNPSEMRWNDVEMPLKPEIAQSSNRQEKTEKHPVNLKCFIMHCGNVSYDLDLHSVNKLHFKFHDQISNSKFKLPNLFMKKNPLNLVCFVCIVGKFRPTLPYERFLNKPRFRAEQLRVVDFWLDPFPCVGYGLDG
jgi:hypothetical protein